jgi:hypothetical protein
MAGRIFGHPVYIHNLVYDTIINQSIQHTVDRHPVAKALCFFLDLMMR